MIIFLSFSSTKCSYFFFGYSVILIFSQFCIKFCRVNFFEYNFVKFKLIKFDKSLYKKCKDGGKDRSSIAKKILKWILNKENELEDTVCQ